MVSNLEMPASNIGWATRALTITSSLIMARRGCKGATLGSVWTTSNSTTTLDPHNETSITNWSITTSRAYLSSSVTTYYTIVGWSSMSLLVDNVENISTFVSKTDWTLSSNSCFYNSSSDTALTTSITTSSGTWLLVDACLSFSSLVKVFRDSIITSSGISSKAYPSRVASFFVAFTSAFFSCLTMLLLFI